MNENQSKSQKDELLTIRQVAEIFSVHQQTLRRWDTEGKLQAVRVGKLGHRKYRKSDIDKMLKIC